MKRGEAITAYQFFILFELIIASLFVYAIMARVNNAATQQSSYEKFYSRDIALTIDAMHAGNGRFSMDYDLSTPKESILNVLLRPGLVEVGKDLEADHAKFYFARSDRVETIASFHQDPALNESAPKTSNFINIEKTDKLRISEDYLGDIHIPK